MAYTVEDLPLEFRPGKLAPTLILCLVIALELIFAAAFEIVARWPVQAFFTRGLVSTLSFLFMVGACGWGLVSVRRRRDRMAIDQTGLVVCLGGLERRYPWTDMARLHLVRVHARSGLHMVAIERRDDDAFDPRANVIWPRFGPSTADLLELLEAGRARWGGEGAP